jgi:hypothetical protein
VQLAPVESAYCACKLMNCVQLPVVTLADKIALLFVASSTLPPPTDANAATSDAEKAGGIWFWTLPSTLHGTCAADMLAGSGATKQPLMWLAFSNTRRDVIARTLALMKPAQELHSTKGGSAPRQRSSNAVMQVPATLLALQ